MMEDYKEGFWHGAMFAVLVLGAVIALFS